ncbi:MAG: hypothetical protein GY906_35595 [bacterium]|nr:hypothetical protein [bacterium]
MASGLHREDEQPQVDRDVRMRTRIFFMKDTSPDVAVAVIQRFEDTGSFAVRQLLAVGRDWVVVFEIIESPTGASRALAELTE